ncbi:MAG TPA: hypothetical protein VNF73_01535, partial [Candidatus Saccharimonadales bacterium]|nr:hypothetical protein [Candidatus Saccharimonadales bacterium]
EHVEATSCSKVLRVGAAPPPTAVREDVRRLLELANAGCDEYLRALLLRYAQDPAETAAMLGYSDAVWQVDRTPDAGRTDMTGRGVVGIGQTA